MKIQAIVPAVVVVILAASRVANATPAAFEFQNRGVEGKLISIGKERNSGYPRGVLTSDGALLVTYRWNNATTTKIVTKSSKDHGATWSDPVDVISGATGSIDLNNQFLMKKVSGELLCAYRRFKYVNGAVTSINLDVSHSTDGGKSWLKLGSIVSETRADIKGEWEPFVREAYDGSLQVYYSHEFNATDQDIVKKTSTDGGKTWSGIVTLVGLGVNHVRPGMPQVTTLDSGNKNLMMVYESNEGGRLRVWAQTSTDGGKTFANPHIIFDALNANAGGPGIVRVPGRLIVSFMTNQEHPDQSYSNLAYVDTKVITSTDGGKTWSPPTKVISQSGWGGLTVDDGGVLVLAATKSMGVVMQKYAY